MKNRFSNWTIALLFILMSMSSGAQVFNPVKWTTSVKQKGDIATLTFKAKIKKHWHLYATDLPSDDGPIATEINIEKSSNYEILDGLDESNFETNFDPIFDMDVSFHENKATFKKRIKIKNESNFTVNASVYFMVCDDSKCLPPEELELEFKVKGVKQEAQPVNSTISNVGNMSGTSSSAIQNQLFDPVNWSTHVEKIDSETYVLVFNADIEKNWHLYSQYLPKADGPEATVFAFKEASGVVFEGKPYEGKFQSEYDEIFDMNLNYFIDRAVFRQVIKVEENHAGKINAEYGFMVCDDARCIPSDFVDVTFDLSTAIKATPETLEAINTPQFNSDDNNMGVIGSDSNEKKSMWGIFFLAFFGGLAALLTPCVFPMVPMTVSFFTKQSTTIAKGRVNAFIYGGFIVLIYVILSLPFHIFDSISPDILNSISTNVWLNITFFIIFVVFAISFFGAFEITLPNSWINKADKASDVGGIIGIFFMALTLALVSFSCTGPILGALLGGTLSSDGGAMALSVGMLGFGIGLALPFGLFAMFPGWLNQLPKSGGWLNSVKVVLGFLELALAFKFLSNADLVVQAGILTREVFIGIWITIFGALTLYLFGKLRLPHDSPLESIGIGRLLIALVSLWFTIYLIPGMWGAPLKIISGFPPPMFYSESPYGVGYHNPAEVSGSGSAAELPPDGSDPAHCPHGLYCFHDYETGLAYAKKVNKPILLDFTGLACVNCRRMEEQVWSDPRVLDRLRNDVVLISLYVDQKTPLPKDQQFVSETTGKKIKSIGNKWANFQVARYGTNSQPYYVILDLEENQLGPAYAYDPDIEKYIKWIEEGKKFFYNKK